MKIISIMSSHRKNGNTAKVIDLINEEIDKIAISNDDIIELETIYLGDYHIQNCTGCRTCFNLGEENCPLKDDISLIKLKLMESDGIIFASPVYVADVNGTMKALIDRLAYICHRQELFEKCVTLIATTHATSLKRAINTMGGATFSWGSHLVGKEGFRILLEDTKEIISSKYHNKIKNQAKRIYYGARKRLFLSPSLLELMIFKIQQISHSKSDKNTLDYKYWENQGWFNLDAHYYLKPKSNKIKILLACMIAKFISFILL